MDTLKYYQTRALRAPKTGDVGVEIEVEAEALLPEVNSKGWKTKEEGSLRGVGREYVTTKPMSIGVLRERLDYIEDRIRRESVGLQEGSPRTSVHVHVNITDQELPHIWNQVVAFWLFENVLVRYCGEEREGNLFCLRLKDSEGIIADVFRDLKSKVPFVSFVPDNTRYAAQNLAALEQFGSIEYRSMRGTVSAELIYEWASELVNLRNNSRMFSNPIELMDTYYRTEKPSDFMYRFFSREFVARLKVNYRDIDDLIEENLGAVIPVAYHHDWDRWYTRIKKANTPVVPVLVNDFDAIPIEWVNRNA